MRTIGLLVFALLLGAPALAEPIARARPAAPASQPRTQRLSFEDDLVTAGRDLGGGDVLSVQRPAKHSSLVRAREDFIPELIKSAEDI